MKQKIYFPLAIMLVIVCAALLVVVFLGLQYKYIGCCLGEPSEQPSEQITGDETSDLFFIPLNSPASPSFISSLSNAKDVKIYFHYEGDYAGSGWARESEFYTPEGSNEKFLSLSKTKKEEGQYVYGLDYYSIFTAEESHSYQGTPIHLSNPDSKYSVFYVGFKINNRELISELKIEFGIDYLGGQYGVSKPKSSVFDSIFGVESVYACGPGIYLRFVGSSNLTFVEEKNAIAWYRLEKPTALYNLSLDYCDTDCSSMPKNCHFWADDPPECDDYFCCEFNASIPNLKNGNLRMHVFYKPNDKEGFLKLQMVNLILSDTAGLYYQPVMGDNFDNYYRAYFH